MPAPANLVHQQSSTTGTGNLTLSAVNGKQSFSTAFGTGSTTNVFDYFISNQGASEWERGTGHMSDATTLVRDTVKEGTNGTSAVNFSAGTKDVVNDRPALEQLRGSQAVNVLEYIPIALHAAIADYTSTTDVSSYIQAAQNALGATQSLVCPPGIYTIGSTLTKRNSTRWLGAGHGGPHGDASGSSSSSDHATIFKWSGSAGGTMIDYAPNGTSSDPVIKGGAITGIALDGNGTNKAGIGLSMKSVSFNVIDMFAKQFTTAAFDFGVVAATSESTRNTEHNVMSLCGNQAGSTDGILVRMDGSATGDANVCYNIFNTIYGVYKNGDAVSIGDTDNNLFLKVWVFRFGGGTGVGVRFRAKSITGRARVNTIIQCLPGDGGVTAEGTETATYPSYSNAIFSYDNDNSAPTPTIGTSATLYLRGSYDPFGTEPWTTYTPTVVPTSGTITTLGTVTGVYIKSGKMVRGRIFITITTNGTGAGQIKFSLPATAKASFQAIGAGAENQNTGKALSVVTNSTTDGLIKFYDGTYPGANGNVLMAEFCYEAA